MQLLRLNADHPPVDFSCTPSGDNVEVVLACDGRHDLTAVEQAMASPVEGVVDLVTGRWFRSGAARHGLSSQPARNVNLTMTSTADFVWQYAASAN